MKPCSVLLNRSPKVKLWSPSGSLKQSRVWLKCLPNVKLFRFFGSLRFSSFRLKPKRRVKFSRLSGSLKPSSFLSNVPTVKLRRPLCHPKSSFWLKCFPNVKLWSPSGSLNSSRVWLKFRPNVKLWSPSGSLKPSRVWLNCSPKVKLWSPCGSFTPSNLRLKRQPKVSFWRLFGKWFKVCKDSTPANSVIPCKENSSSETVRPWIQRNAECKSVCVLVQDKLAVSLSIPCCRRVWSSNSFEELCDRTGWTPGWNGSSCTIIFSTSRPSIELDTSNVKTHSPVMLSTWSFTTSLAGSLAVSMRRRLLSITPKCWKSRMSMLKLKNNPRR